MKLVLNEKDSLARGNDKQIFNYEDDKIIKVVIPDIKKHSSKTREVYREFKECKAKDKQDEIHLQKIFSLIQTNYGVGEICAKEVDEDGNLAQTLYKLIIEDKMSLEIYKKLNKFLAWFVQTKVVLNSLHSKNIVYSYRNGEYEFRIIDGFGDKTIVQFSKILPIFRAKNKMKCLNRLFKELKRLQSDII